MTSHTIYVVFYYYITFFIQCYMNILEFHSMLYTELLISVILLTSTMLMFLCVDWNRTWAVILRGQHSTLSLQGAAEGGIFVSPRR